MTEDDAADGPEWWYLDRSGQEFGPFRQAKMRTWFSQGFFPIGDELLLRMKDWSRHVPLYELYPEGAEKFAGEPRGARGPPGAPRLAAAAALRRRARRKATSTPMAPPSGPPRPRRPTAAPTPAAGPGRRRPPTAIPRTARRCRMVRHPQGTATCRPPRTSATRRRTGRTATPRQVTARRRMACPRRTAIRRRMTLGTAGPRWTTGGAETAAEAGRGRPAGAGRRRPGGGEDPDRRKGNGEKGGGRFRAHHTTGVPKMTDLSSKFGGAAEGPPTTAMLRTNIPNKYSQEQLLEEIKSQGFDNKFDFFYLPIDIKNSANVGYAFINFVEPQSFDDFCVKFKDPGRGRGGERGRDRWPR
ncbi:unnamed protein product [Prorocentrum cordatum]|uniref:GYF domain-containing protein n=1 Tax=Prorocentrum cordatum TaxID=2364126 RepID=A0ABN9SMA4_9DINO|nr:unnamed protein product [Polarella glacialis]